MVAPDHRNRLPLTHASSSPDRTKCGLSLSKTESGRPRKRPLALALCAEPTCLGCRT